MEERAALLNRLAGYNEPVEPLLSALGKLGWDWKGEPLLVLKISHFDSMFDRYIAGDLAAKDLEEWAECLECREDVAFDPPHEEVLDELLFWLANPSINYDLTPDTIKRFQGHLHGQDS